MSASGTDRMASVRSQIPYLPTAALFDDLADEPGDDLYALADSGARHFKIGRSIEPTSRLRSLDVGPGLLSLVAIWPGAGEQEKLAHELYKHLRVRSDREWFRTAPELRAFIEADEFYGIGEVVLPNGDKAIALLSRPPIGYVPASRFRDCFVKWKQASANAELVGRYLLHLREDIRQCHSHGRCCGEQDSPLARSVNESTAIFERGRTG
jgi:hypothetical protein